MAAYSAVLFYIIWMIVLALFYAFPRVPLALMGKKSIGYVTELYGSSFPRTRESIFRGTFTGFPLSRE